MATDNLTKKRKTAENNKNNIISAKVVANFGDPGLDENENFDILSRFIIVAIESVDRIPTNDKWTSMLAAVKRPESLWIDVVGNVINPTDQQRSDNLGNTNTGLPSSYSVNGIARINQPYQVGETINIKKLSEPLVLNNQKQSKIFFSKFSNIPQYYNDWYNTGAFLPYIQNNNAANNIKLKTISKVLNSGSSNFYYPILNKYQYEVFSLLQNINDTETSNLLIQIFDGSWRGTSQIYNAHGGYIFNQNQSINIPIIEYEDINIGQKQRVNTNSCIPLVVVTPNSFPVPKARSTGTINYSPQLVPVGI